MWERQPLAQAGSTEGPREGSPPAGVEESRLRRHLRPLLTPKSGPVNTASRLAFTLSLSLSSDEGPFRRGIGVVTL